MPVHHLRSVGLAASTLLLSASYAQLADSFTDGDFAADPAWAGIDALFTVVDDGGNQRLRSNSPGAANYYLSTPNTLVDDARWEFFVDTRFSTSGANYVDVYLMSDAAVLSTGVNGYFLRIGGTADRLELFRSDAGTATSTGLQSPDGVVNSSTSNPFRIQVDRTAAAAWTLRFDDGVTGTWASAGTLTETTWTSTGFFGIRIEQSSAGSVVNNHFFDDVSVAPIPVDNLPPELLSATIISDIQVDLAFNEAVDPATSEEENNYGIIPFNGATSAVRDATDHALVHLTLDFPMQSGNTYTITVNGVEDLVGNACSGETVDVLYFVPDVPQPGDVIINEIMADPDPPVGLPNAEFIGIHNATTDRTFDLAGWTIADGTGTGMLPAGILPPGAYVILCDDGTAPLFTPFGTTIGFASFPSALTNTGETLTLSAPGGTIIDAVTYSDTWYHDEVKRQGGWTLERIDPTAPCSGASNWTASTDQQGGTPGTQNSVFAIVPDNTPPAVTSTQVIDANTIALSFNEAMDVASLPDGTYTITPSIAISAVVVISENSVQLTLAEDLVAGVLYGITVDDVSDCPGNPIGTDNSAGFALPEPVAHGDVVINEVLYDPRGSGSDMVELYNRSQKTLSLAGWKLANVQAGMVADPRIITPDGHLLLPGQYVLVCEDAENIMANYPQSHVDRFVVSDLPSYNNGSGSVVLLAPNDTLLDRTDYNDNLHFALLNSTDGVSLERVNPDRPSNDQTNWHSAAELAGWATPGFQNSQYSVASAAGELSIERAVFSPDNDGYEDVLTIGYRFDAPGFTGTLKIFDVAGREVRTLLNNQLLGTTGAVSWDGITEGGSLARMGPYVVMLEAFAVNGDVERFRQAVVLAHKLN